MQPYWLIKGHNGLGPARGPAFPAPEMAADCISEARTVWPKEEPFRIVKYVPEMTA